MDVQQPEEIRLSMPASPELLRVARLTAAGLANRVGFDVDEIDDIKIAVDELCFAVVGSTPRAGTLSLRFLLEPGQLVIEGSGPGSGDGRDRETSELSTLILDAVVDEHELTHSAEEVRFRLRKRRAGG
ncbi:MAG: ATP-binding protein [Acidimicrobiia bacterium]|nr:ATP-binding protein [Acidimicrobiia bacterium]